MAFYLVYRHGLILMDPIRLALSSDFREEQSEAQRDELTQITQQQAAKAGFRVL